MELIKSPKRKIRQIEKINNRKEMSRSIGPDYQHHNWKLYKHKHLSNQLKTIDETKLLIVWVSIKIIYKIKFLFINTTSSFALCVFVADMQQCDIYATVL